MRLREPFRERGSAVVDLVVDVSRALLIWDATRIVTGEGWLSGDNARGWRWWWSQTVSWVANLSLELLTCVSIGYAMPENVPKKTTNSAPECRRPNKCLSRFWEGTRRPGPIGTIIVN